MDTTFPLPINQPDNPTNAERHTMGQAALRKKGRPEDLAYIKALLAPPPEITSLANPGRFKGVRVGIIGGGLAGLSAAFELKKLGFDCTVFDALKERIGGRVYTYYFDREKKLYGEFGAMRIPVLHETVWHYINLFGLYTLPFIQDNENALIYLKNTRVKNDPAGQNVMQSIYPAYDLKPAEQQVPWQQLLYHGVESPLLAASAAERGEILQIRPEYSRPVLTWDACSGRQTAESTQLSHNAINLISNFVPLMGQNLYSSYLDYIQEQYTADLSYLYQIQGGMVSLPEAFLQAITGKSSGKYYPGIPQQCLGNVEYKAGCRVEEIHRNPDNEGVVLRYTPNNGCRFAAEEFDFVICAIPFSALRTVTVEPLFSLLKMQAIREVNYIPSQKTCFLCGERFWEYGGPGERIFGGVSVTDLPVSQICYPSYQRSKGTACPGRGPGVLIASYNFNLEATRLAEMPEPSRFRELKREVEQAQGLPAGYLDSVVSQSITHNWNTDPRFRGALSFYTPGQRRLFSVASVMPEYDGRVFFAGEHTSAKHRWMQGALKSGMDAANQLVLSCLHQPGNSK